MTSWDLDKIAQAGIHPHDLKEKKHGSHQDLYKDDKGDVYVGNKDGSGNMEPTNINLNNLDGPS